MSVTQIFSGDTKDLEAAYRKLVAEDIKLRAELQKTASESKKHGHDAAGGIEEMSEAIGDQVKEIGHMVLGLASIEKGVEFVLDAYGEWREEMKKLGQEHKAFADDLAKSVGASGDIRDAPKIEAIANRMQYASLAETTSAFKEVRGAAPGMDESRRQELAEAAARTAPLTDAGQMGRLVGNLGQMLPDKSGEELAGLGLQAQHQAGNSADQLSSNKFLEAVKILQKGGMAAEESLGIGTTAIQENLSPKLLESLAVGIETAPEMVQQKKQKPRRRGEAAEPPEPLTADEEAQNKLAATTSIKERLELAKNDKSVRDHLLGQKGSSEFELILGSGKIDANIDALRNSGRYSEMQLTDAAADRGSVGLAMQSREKANNLRRAQEENAIKALKREHKQSDFEAGIANDGWLSQKVGRTGQWMNEFLEDANVVGDAEHTVDRRLGGKAWHNMPDGMNRNDRLDKQREQGFEIGPGLTGWRMLEGGEEGEKHVPRGPDLGQRAEGARQSVREKLHGFGNLMHNYGDKIRAEAREPGEKQVDKGDATRELVNLTRETNSLLRRGGQNTSVNAHSE